MIESVDIGPETVTADDWKNSTEDERFRWEWNALVLEQAIAGALGDLWGLWTDVTAEEAAIAKESLAAGLQQSRLEGRLRDVGDLLALLQGLVELVGDP